MTVGVSRDGDSKVWEGVHVSGIRISIWGHSKEDTGLGNEGISGDG